MTNMADFSKILLPVDLEQPPLLAVHQGAALARHFHSEILMLHVVRPISQLGMHELGHRDLHSEAVKHAEADLDARILPELAGLQARRLVVKGSPGHVIPQVALQEKASLIVMASHGLGALASTLMGSVSASVLDSAPCPVWTASHAEAEDTPRTTDTPQTTATRDLAIRSVLCALDFGAHSPSVAREAVAVAAAFGAKLTMAHVTPSVEQYGPGGTYELPDLKESLVSSSRELLTKLRDETGAQAEFFIGSGSVAKVLAQAASETAADLLVIGRRTSINRLGANNYAIIRDSQVPVLSV